MNPRPWTLLTALTFAFLTGCITHIDAGHVGVKTDSCSGGGVDPNPVPVGYHTTGPCTSIVEFPTYTQTLILGPEEGQQDDSVVVTAGGDSSAVNVAVSLSFDLDDSKVPSIYKRFRKGVDMVKETYIRQTVKDSLQKAFTNYTAEQVHGPKREEARAIAEKVLSDTLNPLGFHVTQFTINNITPPANVLAAINAKVVTVQTNAMAQASIIKSEAEGRQRIVAAEADAKTVKLRADAEAYANQKLASSLSPVLIEYERTKKWDGKMPVYSGSSTPLIQLK